MIRPGKRVRIGPHGTTVWLVLDVFRDHRTMKVVEAKLQAPYGAITYARADRLEVVQ